MPRPAHPFRGYLFIAGATFCWALAAAFGRAVFTGKWGLGAGIKPIDPLILAQCRTTFSFLALLPVLLWKMGAAPLRVSRRSAGRFLLLGTAGFAASNYFYYLAIQLTNVATAIILQYTAPVFVLLYMVMSGQQRATSQRVWGVALAVCGCAIAIGTFALQARAPWVVVSPAVMRFSGLGVLAAMTAAISFAFYNVYARRQIERYDRWTVLLYALGSAALFWAVVNPPWRIAAQHYTGAQWIFLVVFALLSVLLPFSLYFTGLHYLDATRAIVTSCLEPVFAIAIAAVALGELVAPIQVVGIVIVLCATILVQLPGRGEPAEAAVLEPIE